MYSVDYSVDVPIGSNILKQLSDVYRKVRNTARYLLGNIHDYDPNIDSFEIDQLPLLDQWMLADWLRLQIKFQMLMKL